MKTLILLILFPSIAFAEQMPTVRISINNNMIGSGTIISGSEGLILSCAHIFPRQESNLKSIQIELFDKTNGKTTLFKKLKGKALLVLHQDDLSLIQISPTRPGKVKIAKTNYIFQRNERLYSWGCRNGAKPTGFWCNYRKRLNPNYIETTRYAAQGRSGGGLFNLKGELVGVLVTHAEQTTQYVSTNRINALLTRRTMVAFVRDG